MAEPEFLDPNAAANSPDTPKWNQVHFVVEGKPSLRLILKLEGELKLDVGLKPNLWTARVAWSEFDKLAGDPNRRGQIEFYFNRNPAKLQPDFQIQRVTLVDVEAVEFGRIEHLQWERPVAYRLTFADFRIQYQIPRGGRLRLGMVNPGPKLDNELLDSMQPNDKPVGTELSTREMMLECLKLMAVKRFGEDKIPAGSAQLTVPKSVKEIEAPRDVRWFGNHAPTELEKLLALTGCVYCPQLDGTGTVEKIGEGGPPALDPVHKLPEYQLPNVDRRGKTVIFSSYPTRAVEVLELDGPDYDTWNFVLQESKEKGGHWNDYQYNSRLTGPLKTPFVTPDQLKTAVRNNFQDFTPSEANYMRENLFRFIRLSTERKIPYHSNVLVDGFAFKDRRELIQVQAKAAYQDPQTKMWKNASEFMDIGATVQTDHRVIGLKRPIMKLEKSPTPNPRDWFLPLANGDMKVRVVIECGQKDKDGVPRPRYYHVGFRRDAGKLVQLTDDEVDNALDNPTDEVAIYTDPTLRPIVVDGAITNKAELEDVVRPRADRAVSGSLQPTLIQIARGFSPAQTSGSVTSVRWSQDDVRTTCEVRNWWAPGGALAEAANLRKLEADETGGDYPNQGKTEAAKKANGEKVAADRTYIIQTPAAMPSEGPAGFFPCRVKKDGGEAGNATDKDCTLTYTLFDIQGNPINKATLRSPAMRRYPRTEYEVPSNLSLGVAYYDQEGTVMLLLAVEERIKTDRLDFMTDYRWNSTSGTLQKRTRKILILEAEDASDWTDVDASFYDCP